MQTGIGFIFSPYDPRRVEILRQYRGRIWDAKNRCDKVCAADVPFIKAELESKLGDTVIIEITQDPVIP
jgi:hypothetical protein